VPKNESRVFEGMVNGTVYNKIRNEFRMVIYSQI